MLACEAWEGLGEVGRERGQCGIVMNNVRH